MRVIGTSIRQAVVSPRFLSAALGTFLILLFSLLEGLIEALRTAGLLAYGAHTQLLTDAMGAEGMALALPILAALPYATAVLDDVKSGYIKAYLPRAGAGRYAVGKALSCALSGGLALLAGVLLCFGASALLLLPKEAAPLIGPGTAARPPSPFLLKCALLFGSGCFWSLTGLLLASLFKSRYLAYAGPFVACYALIILYERYFASLYVLYPREWLNPSALWAMGPYGAAALLLVLSGVVGCGFAYWASRKLVQA